jgi:predicted DNA-binding protein
MILEMGRKAKSEQAQQANAKTGPSPRTSVTFPPEVYSSLETIANRKKVSIAWVIREAAEQYVSDQWPLFVGTRNDK